MTEDATPVKPTDDAILARLTVIVRDVFADPAIDLAPEMPTVDVPGWDSITQVGLLVEIERAFAISLDPLAIDDLATVGDLVDLVRRGGAAP